MLDSKLGPFVTVKEVQTVGHSKPNAAVRFEVYHRNVFVPQVGVFVKRLDLPLMRKSICRLTRRIAAEAQCRCKNNDQNNDRFVKTRYRIDQGMDLIEKGLYKVTSCTIAPKEKQAFVDRL
jgi:hypothetical protein